MDGVVHEILSRIHGILSIASPSDLQAASMLPGISKNMATALRALSQEREVSHAGQRRSRRPVVPARVKGAPDIQGHRAGRPTSTDTSAVRTRQQVLRLIMSSPVLDSKRAIAEFATAFGFSLGLRKKDDRKVAASKLAKWLLSAPEEDRQKMLTEIAGSADRQTEGWFDVIKRS